MKTLSQKQTQKQTTASRLMRNLLIGLAMPLFAHSAFAVNVNTASADEIAQSLTGVGPVLAGSIVQYRTDNGPFESLDQFIAVKGIGQHIVETNIDAIEFSDALITN